MKSANVASSFFMPNYDWEDLKWSSYHLQLEEALYDANTGRLIDKRAKESLGRLDSLLSKFMKNFPTGLNDKIEYDVSIHFEMDEFPSQLDLKLKYLYFISSECAEKKIDKDDLYEQYKSYGEATADCQRVIRRIVKSEPLHLIPEQVKTFERFISRLGYPSKEWSPWNSRTDYRK